MGKISGGPNTFFRVGPANLAKPECFVVERGDTLNSTLSPGVYAPDLQYYLDALRSNPAGHGILSDYVQVNPGGDLSSLDEEGSVSFIPMDAVSNDATGEYLATDRPLREVAKGYTSFRNGDILWAKITPSMQNGKTCIVDGLSNGIGFGSTEFHVLRVIDPSVSTAFVFELISQPMVRNMAIRAFTGSAGQQRVPAAFLGGLPFPKIAYGRQCELVKTMDAARAQHREKLAKADVLLAGMDSFLLNRLGIKTLPEDKRRIFAIKNRALPLCNVLTAIFTYLCMRK